MLLNVVESGQGDRVAVLLHGMQGSAESWWRVAPLLVQRGYRVLAIDLPGHGLSDRDSGLTVETAAASVVETITRITSTTEPALVVGHSYGGLLLAAAQGLSPELGVYVDPPFAIEGSQDRATLTAQYEQDRTQRTAEWLRASRTHYSETDAAVEARAAERFDPATSASIQCGADGEWSPRPGSIVVRADPSNFVSDEDVERFVARGVQVRSIPGAAHSVWYSHFDEFVAALPEVFG